MIRDAVISDDGLYRYLLSRTWDPTCPPMTFVMLNPSSADAAVDDPTIRRCIGFAKREGCGSVWVVNRYAFRTHRPKYVVAAAKAGVHVAGPENYHRVREAFALTKIGGGIMVAAWGAHLPTLEKHWPATPVDRDRLYCLGHTAEGHPRHPLYLPSDAPLRPW